MLTSYPMKTLSDGLRDACRGPAAHRPRAATAAAAAAAAPAANWTLVPVQQAVLDLDLPAEQRWNDICAAFKSSGAWTRERRRASSAQRGKGMNRPPGGGPGARRATSSKPPPPLRALYPSHPPPTPHHTTHTHTHAATRSTPQAVSARSSQREERRGGNRTLFWGPGPGQRGRPASVASGRLPCMRRSVCACMRLYPPDASLPIGCAPRPFLCCSSPPTFWAPAGTPRWWCAHARTHAPLSRQLRMAPSPSLFSFLPSFLPHPPPSTVLHGRTSARTLFPHTCHTHRRARRAAR